MAADVVMLSTKVQIQHKTTNTLKEVDFSYWQEVKHNWKNWKQVGEPYSPGASPTAPAVAVAKKVAAAAVKAEPLPPTIEEL